MNRADRYPPIEGKPEAPGLQQIIAQLRSGNPNRADRYPPPPPAELGGAPGGMPEPPGQPMPEPQMIDSKPPMPAPPGAQAPGQAPGQSMSVPPGGLPALGGSAMPAAGGMPAMPPPPPLNPSEQLRLQIEQAMGRGQLK